MPYPLETAFHTFLKHKVSSPTTIQNYDITLNQLFTFLENQRQLGGQASLKQINETDLRAFFNQQTITTGTYNKKLSHLTQYFAFLYQRKVIHQLPTLALHGHAVSQKRSGNSHWLKFMPTLLRNASLHPYTRVTLLLLSHGYDIHEIILPHFYDVFSSLKFSDPVEQGFIKQFQQFILPLQRLQESQNLFLKLRINRQSPLMSLAGLHKYLKADQALVPFPLIPQQLHRDYIMHELKAHPNFSQQQFCERLRLDSKSLNYYQNLLLK